MIGRDGEVRFGLGTWDGLRSSTWKVWGGADGSVYVANREIGNQLKVSLHPGFADRRSGDEWRLAFTSDTIARGARRRAGSADIAGRVLAAWDSEEARHPSAPFREAYAVVLGNPSLGYVPLPPELEDRAKVRRQLTRQVDWSTPLPGTDVLWQFTVLIGDPGVRSSPPGAKRMLAKTVGRLVLPTSEEVWVMRHLIPFTDDLKNKVRTYAEGALNRIPLDPAEPGVYRINMFGSESSGLRWVIEIGVTAGPVPPELEVGDDP